MLDGRMVAEYLEATSDEQHATIANLVADTKRLIAETDDLILRIRATLAPVEHYTLVDQLASDSQSTHWIRINGKFQLIES